MKSSATTVAGYLAQLPPDRREAISAVRDVILKNLGSGYEEGLQYGMIGYYVPHSVYAPGYHCDPRQPVPFAGLASQKNHMAIYLMCIYGHEEHEFWFREAWLKTGKKLDMGKSCIRFKKLEDVALSVIGKAVRRVPARKFIAHYESVLDQMSSRRKKAPSKKSSGGKKVGKKGAGKKGTGKKRAAKKVASKIGKAAKTVTRSRKGK
ncbi:MAG: DUF1801 domain-containing protein [Planctomycetota bacterium]|jgi:hypothetical protein